MKLSLPSSAPVVSLAVSPDGKWLAVGQSTHEEVPTLSIWDTKTWTCTAEYQDDRVYTLSFNRHSDTLAYTCMDDVVRIFDLKRKIVSQYLEADKARNAVFARHTDRLLVCGKVTSVWDTPDISGSWEGFNYDPADEIVLESGEIISGPRQGEPFFVYDKYLAEGRTHELDDSLFKDYYRISKATRSRLGYYNQPAGAVFCNHDNDLLITGNNDNKFLLYDLNSGELKATYPGGLLQTNHMITDPAEEYLFVISELPKTNLMWKLSTMERALPQVLHDKRVGAEAACFHPSGRYIATGNVLSTVGLIDLQTGDLNEKAIPLSNYTNALIFTPDGKYLIKGDVEANVVDVTKYID